MPRFVVRHRTRILELRAVRGNGLTGRQLTMMLHLGHPR